MPRGVGLSSPAMHLSTSPIKTLLCQVNRDPISHNSGNENHEAFKFQQDKYLKEIIQTEIQFFPIRSTVSVQRDDGRAWMHGVTVEEKSTDHNG